MRQSLNHDHDHDRHQGHHGHSHLRWLLPSVALLILVGALAAGFGAF